MTRYVNIILLCLFVNQINGQYEDEICNNNGVKGVCRNIESCPSAIDDIRNRKTPVLCSFSNTDPIVCCVDVIPPQTQTTTRKPVLTTKRFSTTTEYIPPEEDYVLNDKDAVGQNQCEPIAANLTAPKTGQKAWDSRVCEINGGPGECMPASECLSDKENSNSTSPKICFYEKENYVCCATEKKPESSIATTRRPKDGCEPLTSVTVPEVGQKSWNKCLEYQEKLMRPCTDILLIEGKFRQSKCNHDSLALILEGGVLDDEYPHMVLLGYGDDIKSMSWLCEGVIISERFILSFASCGSHRRYGPVKYIRTGVLNMSEPVDESKLFKIKQIIKHPSFKSPKPYNDIALLEIDNDIPLDLSTTPACIDVGNLPSYEHAVALGWDLRDSENTVLQRGHLFKEASSGVCGRPGARNPFDNTTQICYANK